MLVNLRKQNWGRKKFNPLSIKNILIATFCLSIAFFLVIESNLKPIVELVAAQRAHLEVVSLINEAVYDQMGQGVAYQDLIDVTMNDDGTVSLIQPNTIKITRLATAVARDLEEKISALTREDVAIPLGLLTGFALLADKGPNLTITILPMGSVTVDVADEFISAGINQTRHRVVLEVNVELGILIPFESSFTQISNTLPIVESIIVGPIPDTYLNMNGETSNDQTLNSIITQSLLTD